MLQKRRNVNPDLQRLVPFGTLRQPNGTLRQPNGTVNPMHPKGAQAARPRSSLETGTGAAGIVQPLAAVQAADGAKAKQELINHIKAYTGYTKTVRDRNKIIQGDLLYKVPNEYRFQNMKQTVDITSFFSGILTSIRGPKIYTFDDKNVQELLELLIDQTTLINILDLYRFNAKNIEGIENINSNVIKFQNKKRVLFFVDLLEYQFYLCNLIFKKISTSIGISHSWIVINYDIITKIIYMYNNQLYNFLKENFRTDGSIRNPNTASGATGYISTQFEINNKSIYVKNKFTNDYQILFTVPNTTTSVGNSVGNSVGKSVDNSVDNFRNKFKHVYNTILAINLSVINHRDPIITTILRAVQRNDTRTPIQKLSEHITDYKQRGVLTYKVPINDRFSDSNTSYFIPPGSKQPTNFSTLDLERLQNSRIPEDLLGPILSLYTQLRERDINSVRGEGTFLLREKDPVRFFIDLLEYQFFIYYSILDKLSKTNGDNGRPIVDLDRRSDLDRKSDYEKIAKIIYIYDNGFYDFLKTHFGTDPQIDGQNPELNTYIDPPVQATVTSNRSIFIKTGAGKEKLFQFDNACPAALSFKNKFIYVYNILRAINITVPNEADPFITRIREFIETLHEEAAQPEVVIQPKKPSGKSAAYLQAERWLGYISRQYYEPYMAANNPQFKIPNDRRKNDNPFYDQRAIDNINVDPNIKNALIEDELLINILNLYTHLDFNESNVNRQLGEHLNRQLGEHFSNAKRLFIHLLEYQFYIYILIMKDIITNLEQGAGGIPEKFNPRDQVNFYTNLAKVIFALNEPLYDLIKKNFSIENTNGNTYIVNIKNNKKLFRGEGRYIPKFTYICYVIDAIQRNDIDENDLFVRRVRRYTPPPPVVQPVQPLQRVQPLQPLQPTQPRPQQNFITNYQTIVANFPILTRLNGTNLKTILIGFDENIVKEIFITNDQPPTINLDLSRLILNSFNKDSVEAYIRSQVDQVGQDAITPNIRKILLNILHIIYFYLEYFLFAKDGNNYKVNINDLITRINITYILLQTYNYILTKIPRAGAQSIFIIPEDVINDYDQHKEDNDIIRSNNIIYALNKSFYILLQDYIDYIQLGPLPINISSQNFRRILQQINSLRFNMYIRFIEYGLVNEEDLHSFVNSAIPDFISTNRNITKDIFERIKNGIINLGIYLNKNRINYNKIQILNTYQRYINNLSKIGHRNIIRKRLKSRRLDPGQISPDRESTSYREYLRMHRNLYNMLRNFGIEED